MIWRLRNTFHKNADFHHHRLVHLQQNKIVASSSDVMQASKN
jgi:hypothetical protein